MGILKKKRGRKEQETEVTLDLGYEKAYLIETPEECGLVIGKTHGIGARSSQQDSFGVSDLAKDVVLEKGVMAVLADGMGGLSAGEKASMATIISCLHYFDTHTFEGSVPDGLVEMTESVNAEVKEVLGDLCGTSGSTMVAAYVRDDELYWVSVGDSRIFLYRDGELTQLNRDHNYAADLMEKVDAGELTMEEALADPQRNALTSYIGIALLERIDGNREALELLAGDRIMLVSDGVYNTLSEAEILALMQYAVGKSMMSLGVQIESRKKPNQDNYTALLLEVQ